MSDLLYTDVEESLRLSVRGALSRSSDSSAVVALYDTPETAPGELWRSIAVDLGLAALLVPEQWGGAGATAREAAVVIEELGRAVAPIPYLTSAVIATSALVAAGDAASLGEMVDGGAVATLVVPWSSRRGAWVAAASSASSIGPVAGAIGADIYVVPFDVDGVTELHLLGAGDVDVEPLESLDMSRQLAMVTPRGTGRPLLRGDEAVAAVDAALGLGAALLASEQYGVAAHCLESAVEYTKIRVQFARPIGSFQAIKHRLADAFLDVAQAQAVARYAADAATTGDDYLVAESVAQSYCSDVAVRVSEEALQFHGGIGMTWEHESHLYLKRAKADQLALGTPARHRTDLGQLVDLTL